MGEECTTVLRVKIRIRPRGRWGDSDMSVLRSDTFGVIALRLPLLGGRGWRTSELDVEATDDSRGCSTCEDSSPRGVCGTASQMPDGLCVQDGQCHLPGGESCKGGVRQSICHPLSQVSQKRIRAFHRKSQRGTAMWKTAAYIVAFFLTNLARLAFDALPGV
jgi:hypothetical protein